MGCDCMALSLIPVCGTTLLNTFVLHVWMVKWMGVCIHLYAVFPNDYAFSFVCVRFVVTTWQFSFTYIPQDYFTHARARAAILKDMGNGPYDYLNLMIWQKQKKSRYNHVHIVWENLYTRDICSCLAAILVNHSITLVCICAQLYLYRWL